MSTALKQNLEEGLRQALSSRGKSKGMLKAKCPPLGTLGSAVWSALMTFSNPYKVGMFHILCMSKEGEELYNHIIKVGGIVDLSTFDRDGNVLRKLNLM